jgi:hypothetical protein
MEMMMVNEKVRYFPIDRAYGYDNVIRGNILIEDEYSKTDDIDNALDIEKGGYSMDNDKILEKYMDMVNQDRRDMEARILEDARERERRFSEQQRLSEERMEKRFIETMDAIKNQNKIIDTAISKLENKYENLKWWILGTAIATILSVIAALASLK